MQPLPLRPLPAVFSITLALTLWLSTAAGGASLDRPADPVVLTGADAGLLLGVAPGDVVAFRYASGWVQIPLQVDERALVDFADIYDHLGGVTETVTTLQYTDAGTYTGADPDAALDADDEIVFMAGDVGDLPPLFSEPAGVVAGSGVQVAIADPLDAGTGHVYLFERSGGLDPGAGANYADYQFVLLAGSYPADYDIANGPNPENSTVTTPYYTLHIADRWIVDETRILAGAASGADILDRRKHLFGPGLCLRSEDTFADGEGAFVVNKNGPVRGLRSVLGANSGPLTQETLYFYERREDVVTDLRVHAIPGVMDFFDYSFAAIGMSYRNDLNPAGVLINGVTDSVTAGVAAWELVTGPQGSLIMIGRMDTDAAISLTSFYEDDSTSPTTQCTGDADAYGSSGLWVDSGIPNTDPTNPPFDVVTGRRTIYYEAPDASNSEAARRADFASNPLTTTITAWDATTDSDGDGVPDIDDAFPLDPNESADADADGMGDGFEQQIVDFDPGDAVTDIQDVLPGDDFDGDSLSNLEEFLGGTDPTTPDYELIPALPAWALALLAALLLVASAAAVRAQPATIRP
jgi:hypothetical protein